MSRREKYTREWLFSSVAGEVLTMLFVAFTHRMFSAAELVLAWVAVHMIATYVIWSLVILKEEVFAKKEASDIVSDKATTIFRRAA